MRNHGFLLRDNAWVLSPAYDMNPVAVAGGLALNISKEDNRQDLDLVLSVAPYFRISHEHANQIIQEVISAVNCWTDIAKKLSIPAHEANLMKSAFRLTEDKR